MISLRPYQHAAVAEIRAAYAAGAVAPLYVAPTGSGKTTVFAFITDSVLRRRKRVLILVHRRELLAQASQRLVALGVPHGRIAPGLRWSNAGAQVASVHTLLRRLGRMDTRGWAPDLIIVDEAHHAIPGSTWGQVLAHWPRAKLLGVTATPERLDGTGLGTAAGGYFDVLIEGPAVSALTAAGYLAPAELYVPGRLVDAAGVPVRGGDYVRAELAAATDRPSITGDAVAHYRAIAHRLPALAFCVSRAHADHVAAAFRAAGYRSASIDGRMHGGDRARLIADLADGRLHVLVSCDLLGEGVDIPVATAAILLRRTLSRALHLQQVGRVLRPHPGKRAALLLDHVGNLARLGAPAVARSWSLDGVSRGLGGTPRPSMRAAAGDGRELPDVVDGHLVSAELTAGGGLQASARQLAWDLGALRALEVKGGYPAGWADQVYQARAA